MAESASIEPYSVDYIVCSFLKCLVSNNEKGFLIDRFLNLERKFLTGYS